MILPIYSQAYSHNCEYVNGPSWTALDQQTKKKPLILGALETTLGVVGFSYGTKAGT
ncbi:protein of unknown function [Pseudodesulfovibrio piezophilus C1TLV30]|uniref:Uncharacterized protein n=1 Tax=Pseudodesulfovibrio piezophilus (strain DSM 21447 / JCM 15486 / C1TLV30) TaxID=1322246 RepID=M1WMP0_PSEP2|nr:protein of unknown function [Pseudodesulfovibrio piezophilus C1TLV30]